MASTLPTRTIGKTDLVSSAVGFGCMSLTPGFYGSDVDQAATEKTLRKALDLGVTLLNTADFYTSFTEAGAYHQNLKLIGKVLKDYPKHSVLIAMKIGPWIEPGQGFAPPDLSPKAVRDRVDKSLAVLGVDYIDAVVLRLGTGPDPKTPLEETAKTLKALVDEGKIKAIGVSEATVEEIRTVQAQVPISLIELECSLFARDGFKEIIPLARELGASFLAYSPLGRGMLTNKVDVSSLAADDFRKTHQSRFKGEALDNNQKLAQRVQELAEKKGCTSGQLALAWVLAQGPDFIPIPGTRRIPNLEENIKALEVKLSKEEVEELSGLIPEEAVQGSRY